MRLQQAVQQLEELLRGQVAVHTLVLGLRRSFRRCVRAVPLHTTSKCKNITTRPPVVGDAEKRRRSRSYLSGGKVLGVLLLARRGEKHDVVDGLDQLQLHDALDEQGGEQALVLGLCGKVQADRRHVVVS